MRAAELQCDKYNTDKYLDGTTAAITDMRTAGAVPATSTVASVLSKYGDAKIKTPYSSIRVAYQQLAYAYIIRMLVSMFYLLI
jgi:hypothetical protein